MVEQETPSVGFGSVSRRRRSLTNIPIQHARKKSLIVDVLTAIHNMNTEANRSLIHAIK